MSTLRAVVTGTGVVLVTALLAVCALMYLPGPTPLLWQVATAAAEQSLLAAAAGGVVVLVVVVAARRRRPGAAATTAALLGLAILVAGIVPAVASGRAAAAAGVTVDWARYVDGTAFTASRGPSSTEVYARVDGRDLLLDVWAPPARAAPPAGRPAVVLVHGGAWDAGNRSSTPRLDAWLADRGAVVIDVDYRLAPDAGWDEQPRDVACALSWVGARSGELGVDPTRVTLLGASAGAQLALVAAYAPDRFPPSCPGPPLRPAGVVALYPPTDLVALDAADGWRNPEVVPDADLRTFLRSAPEQDPAAWAAASPITHVRAGVPATLLLHGDRDQVVPVQQTRALAEAGRARGADVTAQELPFGNHGYDAVWGGPNAQITRAVLARFLDR